MAKKRSAGLLVMTELPGIGLVATLQRRGEFNHEKMGAESYAGGCQLTAHGGMEDGESPFNTICREAAEELGPVFAAQVEALLRLNDAQQLNHVDLDEKEVFSYGVKMTPNFLKTLQLGPSSGGIVLATKERAAAIRNLKEFTKEGGVDQRSIIAMFPDDRDTVLKGFEFFS